MRISWRFRWFLFGVQTLLGSFCLGTREIGIKGFLFPWSHQENRYHVEPKVFSLSNTERQSVLFEKTRELFSRLRTL